MRSNLCTSSSSNICFYFFPVISILETSSQKSYMLISSPSSIISQIIFFIFNTPLFYMNCITYLTICQPVIFYSSNSLHARLHSAFCTKTAVKSDGERVFNKRRWRPCPDRKKEVFEMAEKHSALLQKFRQHDREAIGRRRGTAEVDKAGKRIIL